MILTEEIGNKEHRAIDTKCITSRVCLQLSLVEHLIHWGWHVRDVKAAKRCEACKDGSKRAAAFPQQGVAPDNGTK
jgi:hypothetical protein